MFDSILFPVDSVLRLSSITACVSLVQDHPDPRLSQSLFLQLLIGAVASAGGGITAATFDVWTPDWKFGTPAVLKSSWVGSTDVWGGAVTGPSDSHTFHLTCCTDLIHNQPLYTAF